MKRRTTKTLAKVRTWNASHARNDSSMLVTQTRISHRLWCVGLCFMPSHVLRLCTREDNSGLVIKMEIYGGTVAYLKDMGKLRKNSTQQA
jgi:hypothetical protein